jgi:hypothetical protein
LAGKKRGDQFSIPIILPKNKKRKKPKPPNGLALAAAGENQAQKRGTFIAQNQAQKTRRLPDVRCTPC